MSGPGLEPRSEGEMLLDALREAGVLTAEQHAAAVIALRRLQAEEYAVQDDGTIRGLA